jgi:hypothetical protein
MNALKEMKKWGIRGDRLEGVTAAELFKNPPMMMFAAKLYVSDVWRSRGCLRVLSMRRLRGVQVAQLGGVYP